MREYSLANDDQQKKKVCKNTVNCDNESNNNYVEIRTAQHTQNDDWLMLCEGYVSHFTLIYWILKVRSIRIFFFIDPCCACFQPSGPELSHSSRGIHRIYAFKSYLSHAYWSIDKQTNSLLRNNSLFLCVCMLLAFSSIRFVSFMCLFLHLTKFIYVFIVSRVILFLIVSTRRIRFFPPNIQDYRFDIILFFLSRRL